MTRREIEAQMQNDGLPSRYDLHTNDLDDLRSRFISGELNLYHLITEVYDRGIVNGRMWQQYIDGKGTVMDEGEVFTLREVSEILKVTGRTALTYVETGSLKASKLGGRWRVRQKDLQAFMAERQIKK